MLYIACYFKFKYPVLSNILSFFTLMLLKSQ